MPLANKPRLADYAEASGIHAEAKDGVLRIRAPKTKAKKSDQCNRSY